MMFPVQILPDVAEPPTYWLETDPRAEAGHFGIISQMVIDFVRKGEGGYPPYP